MLIQDSRWRTKRTKLSWVLCYNKLEMSAGWKPKFWRPGAEAPGVNEERPSSNDESSTTTVFNPNSSLSIDIQRQRLPIFKHRTNILYLLEKYETVIIVGETGCGKSTQIPQVAIRVAEERDTFAGQEVGYCVRFNDCFDPKLTSIKFMTDGILLREVMGDPLLSSYSVIMIDEAHERTLHTDVLLGLLKKIKKKRPDLRIIVSSATLDAEMFKDFFNTNITNDKSKDTAAVLSVEGRSYPVNIEYAISPVANYLQSAVETAMGIHLEEGPGDILVFLTGQEEVESAVSKLIERARGMPKGSSYLKVLPMYSGLPYEEQMLVFKRPPPNTRKVIVATNVAEASITIDGIVYVVDCGFVKLRAYSPATGIESLVVTEISQASAEQRAGRAGRVRAGKAYRLYTEDALHDLKPATVPEMQRSNLAPVLLQLKSMGIDNVLRFDFPARPPAQSMVRGLELLYALDALDDNGKLVDPLGVQMAEFPLEPMIAKMLLISGEFKCSEEILTIAAMLQIKNVFVTPSSQKAASEHARRKFSVYEGDHLTQLNVHRAFLKHKKSSRWCHDNFVNYKGLMHSVKIREQLKKLLQHFKIPIVSCDGDVDQVCRCIVAGFFSNAARYHPSGCYRSVRDDHALHIHPMSVLYTEKPPPWVVYHEILQTSQYYMRDVTKIEPEWLYGLAPHYYEFGTVLPIYLTRAGFLSIKLLPYPKLFFFTFLGKGGCCQKGEGVELKRFSSPPVGNSRETRDGFFQAIAHGIKSLI
ncbi:probable ATP-dependent RNA helicase DHX35 isoform X2 [Nematostella vectensis]|uniref:probable ATP-dependent RNA helicase DHX35 isoform X2 n=1 Tax=Nematostella vectensis TaxID=45351 RepID=UPI0020773679|nr:probable ATP-dependent RNA helicase DHX35 isoform X2 [Nematostella vectensis]